MSASDQPPAQVDVEQLYDAAAELDSVMGAVVQQAAAEIEALRKEAAKDADMLGRGTSALTVATREIATLKGENASLAAEVEWLKLREKELRKEYTELYRWVRRIADALALVREKLVQGLRVYDWGCVKSAVDEIDAALAAAPAPDPEKVEPARAEAETFRCADHATWKASCIGCVEEQGEGLSDDCRRLAAALESLVARCDGAEGVRADGSNIDTLDAHAALGDLAAAPEQGGEG